MKLSWPAAALAISLVTGAGGSQAKDIVQTAKDAGTFTMLLQAVQRAGLEEKLKTPGPFTVFAPTDDAFRALPPDVAKRLMDPANKTELANVLSYHVLAGRLSIADLKAPKSDAKALTGQSLVLGKQGDAVTANEANVAQPEIVTDNGIVHVIDKVLIPPKPVQPTFKAGK